MQIRKAGTTYCLDVPKSDSNDGAAHQLHGCHGGDNQLFGFEPHEGDYSRYRIVNKVGDTRLCN